MSMLVQTFKLVCASSFRDVGLWADDDCIADVL